jgi:hypothetical protein
MAEIINFHNFNNLLIEKTARSADDILNATEHHNWHVLAIELYASGFTADFFNKMNRPARREILIKSFPSNERCFFLDLLQDSSRLLGKASAYGIKSENVEGFTEWEITTLVERLCTKSSAWARAVLINLRNLEMQQAQLFPGLRVELISDAFNREFQIVDIAQDEPPATSVLEITQLDLIDAVDTYLTRASDRERAIISNLYDIDGKRRVQPGSRLRYDEVAYFTGFSKWQVKHTHEKAKRRVKHPAHRRYLQPVASLVNPASIKNGSELFICDMFDMRLNS